VAASIVVLGAVFVSPMWLDARTRGASAWRDWPAVLRLTSAALRHPIIRGMPALRYNFGTLRAAALAGTGRLDEALALVDRVGRDNRQDQSLIDMAKSTVLLRANRYDEAIERRRGAATDPARPGIKVDLAIALLEHRRDVDGAREQLAKVDTPPTSLLEAAFRSLASGLLELEEGRPAEAVTALTRARSAFEREVPATSLEGVMLWTDPFLCLALAQAGERERARAMLPRVTRYLTAVQHPEWLQRCRAAVERNEDRAA
jgi:Flp pilus assembly protein TadD